MVEPSINIYRFLWDWVRIAWKFISGGLHTGYSYRYNCNVLSAVPYRQAINKYWSIIDQCSIMSLRVLIPWKFTGRGFRWYWSRICGDLPQLAISQCIAIDSVKFITFNLIGVNISMQGFLKMLVMNTYCGVLPQIVIILMTPIEISILSVKLEK